MNCASNREALVQRGCWCASNKMIPLDTPIAIPGWNGRCSFRCANSCLAKPLFDSFADRTLHFAKIDWIARRMNKSLFEGLPSVPGYAIVKNPEEKSHPLQKLKIRPGEEQSFIQRASKEIHWRLDFNSSFNLEQCKAFLSRLGDYKIDYIEDPLPSRPGLWHSLQESYGIPFAADFEDNSEAKLLIEKPAARPLAMNDKRRKVVTSYLDHPIGQLSALHTAASYQHLQKEPGGFLSHLVYEPNAFQRAVGD